MDHQELRAKLVEAHEMLRKAAATIRELEQFKEAHDRLARENEQLKNTIATLQAEIRQLRSKLAATHTGAPIVNTPNVESSVFHVSDPVSTDDIDYSNGVKAGSTGDALGKALEQFFSD